LKSLGVVVAAALCVLATRAHAQEPEPWIGRWSIDPAGCTGYGASADTSPLVVTEKTLAWFASTCRIGKLYKTGQDAHIQAHCSSEGVARDTPVSLKPHGDKMQVIWDNRPVGEMRKCR
jgi:hypothetical protein